MAKVHFTRKTVLNSINRLMSDPERFRDVLEPADEIGAVTSIRLHHDWPSGQSDKWIIEILRIKATNGKILLIGANGKALKEPFAPTDVKRVRVLEVRQDESEPEPIVGSRTTLRYTNMPEPHRRRQASRPQSVRIEQPATPTKAAPKGPSPAEVLDMLVLHLALSPNLECSSNRLLGELASALRVGSGNKQLVMDAIDLGLANGQFDRYPVHGRQITRLYLRKLPAKRQLQQLMARYPQVAKGRKSPLR